METKIYNLIIVDKSGSMSNVTKETIAGVNETIGGIQATARKNSEQKQYITLIAFCGCEQRYIFDNVRAEDAHFISDADYQPCCSTPLYDTIGHACICMEKHVGDDKTAAVSVTILTDGYENSSREFNHPAVVALIKRLKEKGWLFAYIGADHDVESVAFTLHIDNFMQFQKNEQDMKRMFEENNSARETYACSFCADMAAPDLTDDEIVERNVSRAKGYFHK